MRSSKSWEEGVSGNPNLVAGMAIEKAKEKGVKDDSQGFSLRNCSNSSLRWGEMGKELTGGFGDVLSDMWLNSQVEEACGIWSLG